MRITLPFFQNANRSRSTVSTRPRNESPITRIWNTSSCDSGLPLYSLSNSDCGNTEYMRSTPTMSRSQYDGLRSRKYHFKILLCYCGYDTGPECEGLGFNCLLRHRIFSVYQNPLLHLVSNHSLPGFIDLLFVWTCFPQRSECHGKQLGDLGWCSSYGTCPECERPGSFPR